MKKYFLALIASSIVISIVFVQCQSPATTEAQATSQLESSISGIASESKKDPDVTHINKLEATNAEKSYATTDEMPKATTVENPKATKAKKHKTTTVKKTNTTKANKPKATTTNNPEAATAEKPKATTTYTPEATTAEKPKTTTTENPEATTADSSEATTAEKPTTLLAADFSLKSVKATVQGTSTLHDWESKVTIMEGKGSFQLKDNVLTSITDAEIKITVTGIISEKGTKMDKKTYETFKSDEYPYIVFSFRNAVVKINDSHVVSIETTGTLSMAGESKSVSLSANGKELPIGDLQLAVSKTIKMTDFKMKPPVMFLGTIKVGDEITVNFDFILSKI